MVHASWAHRDRKENLFTRDGRAERWWQRTGSMRGCGCAEREPARDPSRVRRGALCAEAGARSAKGHRDAVLLQKSQRKLSVCASNGGGDIVQRQKKTGKILLVWKPVSYPSHTHLLHYLSQNAALLLLLHVQCLWGAVDRFMVEYEKNKRV